MFQMQVPRKRYRGRTKQRFIEGLNGNMNKVGVAMEDTRDRKTGKRQFAMSIPSPEKPKIKFRFTVEI